MECVGNNISEIKYNFYNYLFCSDSHVGASNINMEKSFLKNGSYSKITGRKLPSN